MLNRTYTAPWLLSLIKPKGLYYTQMNTESSSTADLLTSEQNIFYPSTIIQGTHKWFLSNWSSTPPLNLSQNVIHDIPLMFVQDLVHFTH